MTEIPFGPQLIGRTEKALNALLDRELSGTGLTEPQWVALTLANLTSPAPDAAPAGPAPAAPAASGPAGPASVATAASASVRRDSAGPVASGLAGPASADLAPVPADQLAARISEALRTDEAAARRLLSELAAAGLVRETAACTVEPTETGRAVWRRVRSATVTLTAGLWGDLPAEDRDTAARVLNVVLTRAGAAL